MNRAVKVLRDSALEAVVFNGIAVVIGFFAIALLKGEVLPYVGIVLLLESVVLMLIGGALDVSNTGSARMAAKQVRMLLRMKAGVSDEPTDEERIKAGNAAATYAVTGVLLFLETGLLSFAFF